MKSRMSLYGHADAMLRSAHHYPLLEHEDAVFLTRTLDECIYNLLEFVSLNSDWFKREYIDVVQTYMEMPADRNSYSSSSDDAILAASLFWITDKKLNWLACVRERVSLYRMYWLKSITSLNKLVETYCADTLVPDSDDDYLLARERCMLVEQELGTSSDITYGIANEVGYWTKRIDSIVGKMVCPYIRRVVVLSKRYITGDPDVFLDNLNSGVAGVHKALGRYDPTAGSYASLVDTWARNSIITWAKKATNPIRVPDRVHTHRKAYERELSKHPQYDVDEAAKAIGVTSDTLSNSLMLADMQSMTSLIDESSTDDFGYGNEAYLDTTLMDIESVNTVVSEYNNVLSRSDKALLALLFDCDIENDSIDKEAIERETVRQLVLNHHQTIRMEKKHHGR